MTLPETLLSAARRILDGAERDVERGFRLSARASAHRAAVLATQAWLEERGQSRVSDSVAENVGLAPEADEEVRAAASLLDRHRLDERALARGPESKGGTEDPAEVVEAGRRVLAFVERRMKAAG